MTLSFSMTQASPETAATPCAVVGVFTDGRLTNAAERIDAASAGAIQRLIRTGDVSGKLGSSWLLHSLTGIAAERVLLVGLGEQAKFDAAAFNRALGEAGRALSNLPIASATCWLTEIDVVGRDAAWIVRTAALAIDHQAYRYTATFKPREKSAKAELASIAFVGEGAGPALQQATAMARGVRLARELGNLPPNICNPEYLATRARAMASEHAGISCEVLEREDMEKLGMGSFLSVARGSHQPPKFIVAHYRGRKTTDKPIVLVGKGITFDTGGISLKPGAEMDEMKFDMCGAASVLGTLKAVARMALPINLTVVVPAVENMPGGNATRPGDIVTSMSGQTVEILNTDAEGRLILCDALTYAERFEPQAVIDVATLTGACVIALGGVASGLLANDDGLARELLHAGEDAADRAWQLPLWDDYQELLKSNFADMANIGGRTAGTITAACFLSRFAKKYDWAHLDIAGTAWLSGKEKGATGRPVPLLTHYLLKLAGKLN